MTISFSRTMLGYLLI